MDATNSSSGDEPPQFDPRTYCAVAGLVVLVGVIGNCLNFVIFSSRGLKRDSLSVFIRAVAISDSIVLIYEILDETLSRLVSFQVLYGHKALCPFVLFTDWFWSLFSSMLLIPIVLDRFIAVAYPARRAELCTYKRAVFVVIGIAVFCFFLSLPEIIWTAVNPSDTASNVTTYTCPGIESADYDRFVVVYGIVLTIIVPFGIVAALDLRGLCLLRSSEYEHLEDGNKPNPMTVTSFQVLVVTVSSLVFLLPNSFVEVAEYVFQWVDFWPWLQHNIDTAWDTTNILRLFHYALSFYFFIAFSKQYRQILRDAFPCWRKAVDEEPLVIPEQPERNFVMDEVVEFNPDEGT